MRILAVLLSLAGSSHAQRAVVAWQAQLAVPPNGSFITAGSAMDASGNVYVFGTLTDSSYATHLQLVKYDARGQPSWTALEGDPGMACHANAIVVDDAGSIFVTGAVWGFGGSDHDWLTARYSPDGKLVWTQRWGSPDHKGDWPSGLAADGHGGVVVTGYTTRATTDYLTIRYDENGQLSWSAVWDSGGDDHPGDFGQPIAVDATTIWVAGESGVVAYALDGSERFVVAERAEGVVLAPGGGVYTSAPQQTLRIDGAGRVVWRAPSIGGTQLAASPDGVVLSGVAMQPNQDWDLRTTALDASGNRRWEKRFDGGMKDLPSAIAVDASGATYVVGETWQPRGLLGALVPTCVTLKYDSAGNLQWRALDTQAGSGRSLAAGALIAVTSLGGATLAYRPDAMRCGWWSLFCH